MSAVGVGKASSRSFDAYSWQSVFAFGASTNIKTFIFGLFEDCKTKGHGRADPNTTMGKCWNILIWSLKVAFEGVWPETDWGGNPWPVGSFEHLAQGKPLADVFVF